MPNPLASWDVPDRLLASDRRLIRAWWYRPQSRVSPYNIGDETTSFVLARVFDITAERVETPNAQLVGAGSILQNAWTQKTANPCHIVGSGFVMPQPHRAIPSHLTVHSVRGYLTRESLDSERKSAISVGDPGLLASEIAPTRPRRPQFTYGIIPHISALAAGEWKNTSDLLPNSTMIDVRTNDIMAFLAAMQDCEVIVSQSLHGLIFADALGIPNAWLGDWDAPVRGGNNFKFFDYFSSVGRPAHLMAVRGPALFKTSVLRNLSEPDCARIRNVQSDIISAFDSALADLAEQTSSEPTATHGAAHDN